jgi:hypothetical protein
MKRFLTICSVMTMLVVAATASAQQRYGWAVSESPSNPCDTSANYAIGGVATIYLWYLYNSPAGMSAADISVVQNPLGALNVLAFTPNAGNGFLNAGTPTNLLLAVGGCPNGPLNAGNWLAIPLMPAWEFCLGGNNVTVNCDINPLPFPNDTHGLTNGGAPTTCVSGMDDNCQPIVSVESASWGNIKSLYR